MAIRIDQTNQPGSLATYLLDGALLKPACLRKYAVMPIVNLPGTKLVFKNAGGSLGCKISKRNG